MESGKIVQDLGLGEGEECSFPNRRKMRIDGTSRGERFGNSDLQSGDRNDQDDNLDSVSEQEQVEEQIESDDEELAEKIIDDELIRKA